MKSNTQFGLISLFAKHKVAATLLMSLIFIAGAWSLLTLNTQFLPSFGLNVVTVRVSWPGASPVDVERAITNPIEDSLSALTNVEKSASLSSRGLSYISLQFKQGIKMSVALSEVKNQVDLVRNLPQASLKPAVATVPLFERVAQVVITADDDVSSLRYYAHEFKRQLIDKGIARIGLKGLPKQEIDIALSPLKLATLRQSLMQIGEQVKARSQRASAGLIGQATGGRQLRADEEKRSPESFGSLPITTGDSSLLMPLLHVANLSWQPALNPKLAFYKGKPAINLILYRTQNENALESAKVLHEWKTALQSTLPEGMQVHVYEEFWQLILERIQVLVKNGVGGLLLIFALLYLFLNTRAAFWVAMGIPISLAAALFMLKLSGGTINMISLFALIMSLGIIVDDTIVVAEQAISEFQAGASPTEAVILGAKKMLTPVLASSVTTIAAFSPLLFLGGIYGAVLVSIPRIIICVIFASLVECFFILPYHFKGGLQSVATLGGNRLQLTFQQKFKSLQYVHFRRAVSWAIHHYGVTLSLALTSLIVTMGLVSHGYVGFRFFPSPPSRSIYAEVSFMSGISTDSMKQEMQQIERAAWQTNDALKAKHGSILKHIVMFTHDVANRSRSMLVQSKLRKAALGLELTSPADRDITNQQFVKLWRSRLKLSSAVESVSITAVRAGPPGFDIDVALSGREPRVLKQAAEALKDKLATINGVADIVDTLPYAQTEILFSLRPEAKAMGLTTKSVAQQLYSSYTGHLVQLHNENQDEIEVRLRLDKNSRIHLGHLEHVPIVTPQGDTVPLTSVATLVKERSFDSLQHIDRQLSVNVTAEVDPVLANANQIIAMLKQTELPLLSQQFGVKFSFKGVSRDQEKTISQMKYLVLIALAMIYIVLAWVSSSYAWPLFVMLAIPFGLEGAILGHVLLGRDVTLLSLFGFFGLTGIVINDSIILMLRYKEVLSEGLSVRNAVIEASCQRFRAVVLTSLSTIAGLMPLLFERSLQAQFLIPMAISICFGLAVSTILILIVIPSAIVGFDRLQQRFKKSSKPTVI